MNSNRRTISLGSSGRTFETEGVRDNLRGAAQPVLLGVGRHTAFHGGLEGRYTMKKPRISCGDLVLLVRASRHDLQGIVGQGPLQPLVWSHGARRRRGPPSTVRITGALDGCCPRQTRRGEPAGRNADEPQRAWDPVGAGALPVVEAGAMTISATAWCPDRSARRNLAA